MRCSRFPHRLARRFISFLGLAPMLAMGSCQPKTSDHNSRIILKYWDKWHGFESDAMQSVVNDFNAAQDKIWVDYSSVSQLERRLMLATAGGVPPDVAGIYSNMLAVYAENNALTPLDKMARESGIRAEDYIDSYWGITTWGQIGNDMRNAVGRIWSGKADAASALGDVQRRQQDVLNSRLKRWNRLAPALTKEWAEVTGAETRKP